jgi:hypothetical protein
METLKERTEGQARLDGSLKNTKCAWKGKAWLTLRDARGRLSKDRKDHTEIELDSIGYASARNAENRTKAKQSEDYYPSTRDYVLVHILI